MRSKVLWGILLLSLLLISVSKSDLVIAQGEGADENALREAVIRLAPRSIIIRQLEIQDQWAVGLAIESREGVTVPGEGIIFIANWDGTVWNVYYQGTVAFDRYLADVPDNLLSNQKKNWLGQGKIEERIGALSPITIQATGYKLPWPAGVSYYVSGAWMSGTCQHSYPAEAVDIGMPLGSTIVAAHAGTVTSITVSNTGCGCDYSLLDKANVISISHDGWQDDYVHIGAALVSEGQFVPQGYPIALSNQIGTTCGSGSCPSGTCSVSCTPFAHLHFQVHNPSGTLQHITFDDVGDIQGCTWYTSGNVGDSTSPTTSHSLNGVIGENGWYRSNVQVTLTASDNAGGSGVKVSQYKIDGGSWQTYGGPFNVTGDGNHTIYYQSQDNAGNWESVKSTPVKIDATPPTNPTSTNPGCTAANNTWQRTCGDPSFTWSGASDVTSGLTRYEYYWGANAAGTAANWTTGSTYNAPAITAGTSYLRLHSKDFAGNWSSWTTLFTLRYDNIAPTGSFSHSSGGLSYTTNPMFTLAGSDQHSGVTTVQLSNDGASWSSLPYTTGLNWTIPADDGQWRTVYLKFADAAGNLSSTYSQRICLDLSPTLPDSASYRLWPAGTIAGGGSASDKYRMYHTEGQPFARNTQSSASYSLRSGFQATWRGLPGSDPFVATGCAINFDTTRSNNGGKVYLPLVIKN